MNVPIIEKDHSFIVAWLLRVRSLHKLTAFYEFLALGCSLIPQE